MQTHTESSERQSCRDGRSEVKVIGGGGWGGRCEVTEGRGQLAASSCCDLSTLKRISRANMHLPCTLGQFPWKHYLSPLHIDCMFIAPRQCSQQSACGSNRVLEKKSMSFMWTPVPQEHNLDSVPTSDPEEVMLQLLCLTLKWTILQHNFVSQCNFQAVFKCSMQR